MADSNYKIVLSASLDPKSIDTELQSIQNKYKLVLSVQLNSQEINNLQSSINSIQKQISNINNIKVNPLEPMNKTALDFEGRTKKIAEELDRISKVQVTAITGGMDERLVKGIATYADATGSKIQKEQFEILETTELINGEYRKSAEYKSQLLNYTDNVAKREREASKEVEKQTKEFQNMATQAQLYLERIKPLSQTNPQVARGAELAREMQRKLGAPNEFGQYAPKDNDINQLKKLSQELTVVSGAVNSNRRNLQSWSTEMGIAIKRIIEWSTGMGLIYGALNQLREGVQYIKELNKEMTNIQVLQAEGAQTNQEIEALAGNFNKLAQEMSVTTIEVAKGSTEFLRQGKTIAETQELLRSTMMLSKLGAMDSASATEALTAVTNAYKLTAEETVGVVDRLVAVDNESATSAQEIVEALKRTSSFAQMAGVDINDLIGYIATVSSVTRKSAETIGTSFQAMFSRLENIRLSGFDAEDETTLNQVEETLGKIGIKLRESETEFRSMSDVLKDIHSKWADLNDIERAAVSQAIAGTRQRENFIVLMEHYNDAVKLSGVAADSAGTALKRYAIYEESIEAASNRLTTAWQRMWSKAVNSEAVKNLYQTGVAILDLIDKAGGLENVILGVVTALVLLNAELIRNQIILYSRNIQSAISALTMFGENIKLVKIALSESMNLTQSLSLGFGTAAVTTSALIVIIGALVAVWMQWNKQIVETQKAGLQGTASTWSKHFANVSKEGESATEVLKHYKDAVNGVNDAYERGGIIAKLFVDKQEILKQGLIETIERLGKASSSWDEYKKSVEEAAKLAGYKIDDQGKVYKETRMAGSGNYQKQYVEGVEVMNREQHALVEGSKMAADSWVNTWKEAGSAVKQTYTSLVSTLSQLQKEISATSEIAANQINQKLSFGDIEKLAEIYPDYLDALSVEQGRIELNTDKIRDYNIEKAEAALKAAEHAREQAIEKKAGDAYIQSLDKQIELLRNYVDQTREAIPISREYIHTVQGLIDTAGDKMGAGMTDSFKEVGLALATINKQYENGEITAKDYFNTINDQLQGLDIDKMFAGNQEAAQNFFAGLVLNAGQSLSQISSLFDSGQLSITEYTDSLMSLVGMFENIGSMVESFGTSLGLTGEEVSIVSNAVDSMSASTAQLSQYQEMNVAIQQMMRQVTTENLQAGTEEYNQYAENVANAAAKAGYVYTDLNGKVYKSAQEITGYLETSNSNFMSFAGQTGNMTGRIIEGIVHQAGNMLVELGKAINNFKGKITIQPTLKGMFNFGALLAGMAGNFFQLPAIDLDIGTNVGEAVMAAGNALQGVKFNMDEGIYKIPSAFNQVSDSIGGASDAANRLDNAIKNVNKDAGGTKDTMDDLKSLLDMVIAMIKKEKELEKDALKEKLDNYKKIIDERKKLLDSMEKEHDYQDELSKKQKKLGDLESEMLELQLDDSEESRKKQLELAQQIADQRTNIEDDQYKHSIDSQKNALDEEYKAYEETINDQIKVIEDYLSQAGTIAADAMALINEKSDALYNNLLEWNRKYGDGMDQTVIKAWNSAYAVLDKFRNGLGQIDFAYAYSQLEGLIGAAGDASDAISGALNQARNAASEISNLVGDGSATSGSGMDAIAQAEYAAHQDLNGNGAVGYHTGAEKGPVGGLDLGSNEQLAKLLAGEIVVTPQQSDNFFNRILPSLMGAPSMSSNINSGSMGDIMPIIVNGNLDKSVLPSLEKIANKVIEVLCGTSFSRGNTRRANSFGI